MNHFKRCSLLAYALSFSPLLSVNAENTNYRTSRIELTHQMAKDATANRDLLATMSGMGIDFPVLLQRALGGEERAVRLLIWTGEHAGLDGAASEGYSYTLVKVAKKIGDEKMAAAAKQLKMTSFKNTQMFIEFEFGIDDNPEAVTKAINKLFPKFWRQITKQGQQATSNSLYDE